MLTSLPPPPQVEDDDPRGAGGTEEVFEAEVDQVWQLARLFSFRFFSTINGHCYAKVYL